MANNQSSLNPAEQQLLFSLLKKSGQQPMTGGMSQDVPDMAAQNGTGAVDQSGLAQLFNQQPPAPAPTPLQQQPGDLMHPQDAMAHITNLMANQANGQALKVDKEGRLTANVPVDQPLLKLFGITHDQRVDTPNFYSAVKEAKLEKYLPSNLPKMPDGTPFVPGHVLTNVMTMKSLLPTSNNPQLSRAEAIALQAVTPEQADQLYLTPDQKIGLNELRLGVNASIANTRKGQLGVAKNALEGKLGLQMQRDIAESEQRNGSPMGLASIKLQNSMLARQSLANRYNADTDTYDLNPTEFGDLAIAAAKSLNSTGVLSNEQIDAIKQATLKGDMGRLGTYLGIPDLNGSTQTVIRRLVSLVDREGLASEQARNLYAQQNLPAHDILRRVNPAYYDNILNKSFGGISYSQLLADSKDTQSPNYITPSITPLHQTSAPVNGAVPLATPTSVASGPLPPPTAPKAAPTKQPTQRKSLPGMVIH